MVPSAALAKEEPAIPARRTIHTQGDFDGACFVYAIANAYTALTGRVPKLAEWGKRVQELPHMGELIDPSVGTGGTYEKEPELLARAAERLLSLRSDQDLAVQRVPAARTLADVADLIDECSVVVLRYRGSSEFSRDVDHWVCAVASDARSSRLQIACSIRWSDVYRFTEDEYDESEVSFARRANDSLREPRAQLVEGSVLLIRAV